VLLTAEDMRDALTDVIHDVRQDEHRCAVATGAITKSSMRLFGNSVRPRITSSTTVLPASEVRNRSARPGA
jgi:hypothetical protein